MQSEQIVFTTPTTANSWQRWMVFSPVARLAFFVASLYVLFKLTGWIVVTTGINAAGATPLHHAMVSLITSLLVTLISYTILVWKIEQRPMSELALRNLPKQGLLGLLAGAALFSSVVLVLWLAGSYHVTGTNPEADWIPAVLTAGIGAWVCEEIWLRGALFRIVEEGLGTWWALAISALFFGALHIANPAATVWSSLAIAIEAGVLFALLYHVTRSLWPCIGLHAAWNVTQGTVFGIPVSGTEAHGWLVSTRTGPDWLSGGEFGAEASVVALLLCSCCSVVLLVIALRRGTIVPPSWRRKA